MDDIAQVCHMQKASLYHYFESKQQMLQEMVDLECARWSAQIKQHAGEKTLKQMLRSVARQFLSDMDDPARREFFKIIYFESHKNPAIRKAFKQSPTNTEEGFNGLFKKYLDQGQAPHLQTAMLATQFIGALIHYAALCKLGPENACSESWSDEDYMEQLIDIFVKGSGLH